MKRMFNKSGTPKYLRVYSNEGTPDETIDCITAIFTEPISGDGSKRWGTWVLPYVSSSKTTEGIYERNEAKKPLEWSGHKLGRVLRWDKLDTKLRAALMEDYLDYYLCESESKYDLRDMLCHFYRLQLNLCGDDADALACKVLGI